MNDRVPLRPGYRLWLPVLAVALVLTSLSAIVVPPATVQAAPSVTVRVVVERLKDIGDNADTLDDADFYGRAIVDGETTNFPEIIDEEEPSPTNWATPGKLIDVAVKPSIAVNIRVFDNDNFLNFLDNEFDISPEGGTRGLDLTVDLNPCRVTIDTVVQPGLCGASITTSGSSDLDAEIQFRVEIDYPAVTGLNLRCTHTPVWPQPGGAVPITAEALDGALAPRFADRIELFINNQNQASPSASAINATQVATNLNLSPTATSFFYGCRIVMTNGDTIWSGWRRVQVGMPPASQGRAVPISVTGNSDGRVDFVFIPDTNSYPGGATNATFLNDVASVIRNAFYAREIYLSNQDAINFWIAQDAGTTALTPVGGSPLPRCTNTAPTNWGTAYPFVDAGVLLHVPNCRDSANPNTRIFSIEPTSLPVVLHESGHRPFGLADEYCSAPTGTPGNCDGGYFQANPNPNLYTTQAACQADTLAASIPGSCGSFVSAAPTTNGTTFWRLDANLSDDLMQVNGAFRAADTRRHDWLFTQCRTQRC
ncbi:MAG: hypothetical protein IT340_11130 [Chloroflexi bacterium]|nr:hypothetical protein [Chloroflexota bacterium]